jgi:hypothetical protein
MRFLINNSSTNQKECIMKKLLISLVVFSVLFVIGCQENSITDPDSSESVQKVQITGENFTSGIIPLKGILVVPGGGQTYYSIEGQINYTHELVLLDPAPPAPQYYIDLNLSVRAVLTDEAHNTFTISSTTEDNIYVADDGISMLQKSFPVLGRSDGMVLVCRFLVTTDGIGLNSKWLAFSDQHGINKSSVPGDNETYPPVIIDQQLTQ